MPEIQASISIGIPVLPLKPLPLILPEIILSMSVREFVMEQIQFMFQFLHLPRLILVPTAPFAPINQLLSMPEIQAVPSPGPQELPLKPFQQILPEPIGFK